MADFEKLPYVKTPQVRDEPFLVAELHGRGCGMPSCGCSHPDFITICVDDVMIKVELSREEAERLLRTGGIEL